MGADPDASHISGSERAVRTADQEHRRENEAEEGGGTPRLQGARGEGRRKPVG